jgi:hypothetical protein
LREDVVHEARLLYIAGDTTKLEVDAVVNAANSSLMGGGGVDGAILDECKAIRTVKAHLDADTFAQRIYLGFFKESDLQIFTEAINAVDTGAGAPDVP